MKSIKRLTLLVICFCLAAISQLIRLSAVMNRVLPPEYQMKMIWDWDRPSINEGISNETISACLLTYDDNHFLIEWLAFHYQTLPLRRLIVATDPRSRTSPSEILQRWEVGVEPPLMNITQWTDDDYFPLSYRRSIFKSRKYNNTTDKLVLMHRYRQRFFYLKCMQTLQREHDQEVMVKSSSSRQRKNWVTFIDVDEYLFPNRNWDYKFLLPSRHQTNGVTVAQLLYRLQNSRNFQGPCIGLPKLLFGTKMDDDDENNNNKDPHLLALLLDGSINTAFSTEVHTDADDNADNQLPRLLTWTWKWHEALQNHASNKAGKAIIDLSRVSPNVIQLEQIDVHRPVMNCCTIEQMWTSNTDSPLVLHHYVGTLEQFTFRSDPREGKRTPSKYLQYQNVNFSTVHPGDSRRWLTDFVQAVGMEKAKMLLKGAGQVDKSAPPVLSAEESFQKLADGIFPGGLESAATTPTTPLLRRTTST